MLINRFWDYHKISGRPVGLIVFVPVILIVLATWLTLYPLSVLGYFTPFMLYLFIVFISSCYGGYRSALFAALAAAACAFFWLRPQYHSIQTFTFPLLLFLFEAMLITGVFKIIENVHAKLHVNEERFRSIIERSVEGFMLADAEGHIRYVTHSAEELLGYTQQELNGVNLQTLVHPDEIRSFELRFLNLCNRYAESIYFLQRLKTKGGGWVWVEGTVCNLLKDQRIKSLVFNYRNVSDRVDKARQQEDFVHMAAHELKTPITALKGFSQLLKLNHQKEGRDKDHYVLDRMDMQLNKLLGLIDDMLDVTRIKAGELHYHFKWFNFNDCVQEAVEAIQTTTVTHRLALTTTPLPFIFGDKDKLSQVISNMVNNAIKYSPGKNTVELKVEKDDGYVYLKVKDYGIGIPKSKQKNVFERFYRVDTLPKDTFGGLGLGLYIAMEIIKNHHGRVGLTSEEGKGAEFWFSLPLKTPSTSNNSPALNSTQNIQQQ